jgi:hypothetical protein
MSVCKSPFQLLTHVGSLESGVLYCVGGIVYIILSMVKQYFPLTYLSVLTILRLARSHARTVQYWVNWWSVT